jgi:uncharacterized protein involved in tolerance to divalent cations
MTEADDVMLVLTTVADAASAERIARQCSSRVLERR